MDQELQTVSISSAGAADQGGVSSEALPASPELLPLDRPLQSRKSNKLLPFKDAGRDFCRPNIELAMLSALLNSRSVAQNFVALLDKEDFHEPRNQTILAAFLHLFDESGVVTRESLETYLAVVVTEFDKEWQDYIDQCMATQFNEKHIGGYVKDLKEAADIRSGSDGYCVSKYSELFYTDRLRACLPPARCVDKEWYQYTGGIWSTKDKNLVRKMALEAVHPNHRQWKRVADVIEHAQSSLQFPEDTFVGAYRFSEGAVLINVANGIIAISADGVVQLRPHDPGMYFTAKLAAAYDPDAPCTLFDQTLQQALPDPEDRALLQRFAGYILFPGCKYEVALVCYGPSGTGKSTIILCLRYVLGDSVCSSAGLEELCKTGSYSLPMLKHKMLNLGSELCSKEIEESSNFKQLVSGETLNARPIFSSPVEMRSTSKLLFLSNNMPRFRSGTDAEARRLRILHFNQSPEKRNPDLKEALKKEASGVLNWMIQGLRDLLREQSIPEGGEAAKRLLKDFNQKNDPVGSFVAERCVLGPDQRETKPTLVEAYRDWCKDVGIDSEKMENFFFKTLQSRYPDLKNSRPFVNGKRERCFLGIGLNEDCDGSDDAPEHPIISPFMLEKLRKSGT